MYVKRLENDKLLFDEEKHLYTFNGVEMVSVTEFLGKFSKEFDTEENSKRVAKKRGVSQQEILDEWESNRDYALDFGSKIHKYAELVFKGMPPDETEDENELAYRSVVDKFVEEHPRLRYVASELSLCSPLHCLAGTADLVLTDGEGKYFLYDWKTSKEINEFSKFKDKMLAPFLCTDDCNFNKYALQLNLYNYMLKKRGVYPNGLYIIHLKKDGYKEYKVPFMDDEVNALLTIRLLGLMGYEE